jgi:hypothetical protein
MDLKVFITNREAVCSECGKQLGSDAWITLVEGKGALCLPCADLDHLVFLPSGDAALTRRSGKYSILSAVVLKWSRARKLYERQGILVEEAAIQRAEQESLQDADLRARRQERDAERRAEQDQEYIARFAKSVRKYYPHCPDGHEQIIAEHACQKYSGRVGRSAEAKSLDERAILLAVVAHIWHRETNYDELLKHGLDRSLARSRVEDKVDRVLTQWKIGK